MNSARRAVLRWAWRLFRREWRQQVLVLGLMTIAVAICVGGSAFAVNSATAGRGLFGDAGALIRLETEDPATLQATLAAARQRFGALELIGHQTVAVPGSPEPLDLRSQDPHGRFSQPTLGLRSGRYPANNNEVALTKGAATLLATSIGQRVTLGQRHPHRRRNRRELGRPARRLRSVGAVDARLGRFANGVGWIGREHRERSCAKQERGRQQRRAGSDRLPYRRRAAGRPDRRGHRVDDDHRLVGARGVDRRRRFCRRRATPPTPTRFA